MELNGKKVDLSSLLIGGIDPNDGPDFCDAYFAFGCYEDGQDLLADDLDELAQKYPDKLHEMVYQFLY